MRFFLEPIGIFVGVGIGAWLLSFLVEALRSAPEAPKTLSWAPEIPITYVDADRLKLRYIRAGRGPNLVLLHTLQTQLDLFQKVIPRLTERFTVYALDYPGHGFSDIPKAPYDADYFVHFVEGFLDKLDVRDVTLCGVSIGAAIALILAGRGNTRITRVVAINPYDYAKGRSLARSSPLGWIIMTSSRIPVVGETVMRLRNFMIVKAVLHGGVANPESIPSDLLKEMYGVGNRPGHYRAFISLLRNAESWQAATQIYARIRVPVTLVWGDRDWATPEERKNRDGLPGLSRAATIDLGGHFLPLDRPEAVIEEIETLDR